MKKVIHKFSPNAFGKVELPDGKVISVCVQYNKPVVYLERDEPVSDDIAQEVLFIGTGWSFDSDGYSFIGTVITHSDSLVHHAYLKRNN